MFEREHHRRIARVLEALDADLLASQACHFGGGTAMALRYGEYRKPVDIDFMVSRLDSYRQLRQGLAGQQGIQAIARPGVALEAARAVRADQYGLRALVRVDKTLIKFEIVLEGRIAFETPAAEADRVCGVATLTPLDLAAYKLPANSDRWRDDAVFSRDLIDLAMMAPPKKLLSAALDKAAAAYGANVEADLTKAIAHLRAHPQRLDACMAAMKMTTLSKTQRWTRIKTLSPRAAKPGTGSHPESTASR